MADKDISPSTAALRKLEAGLHLHWQAHRAQAACGPKPLLFDLWRRIRVTLQHRLLRRSLIGVGIAAAVIGVLFVGMWWRLASGPIEIDLATPWLTAAIEENFGSRHHVEVGGTQLERDETGRTRLRIRDIVVRDPDGTVVASAPKAEVGFSGASLFMGRVRAERLSLVGAEMAVRIEPDGKVTVFAGADKRPIATAVASEPPPTATTPEAPNSAVDSASSSGGSKGGLNGLEDFTALLAWIDGLGASGLDGHDLTELGLKSGNLVVDDQRNGKRWSFENINLSLTRPAGGGVLFSVSSEAEERPWLLSAAVAPLTYGRRVFNLEARRVAAKDLLLALRLGEDPILAELPISASLHAEIGADGATQALQGRIIVDAGSVGDAAGGDININIDRAEFNLDWDASRRILTVPFQVVCGSNRLTLFAQIEPPRDHRGAWTVGMTGGTVLLGATGQRDDDPLVFNRIMVRARIDPKQRRVDLEQGDLGNAETGLALSGTLDYSGAEPRLAIGLAGTRMKVSTMRRLWPFFIAPGIREWVEGHIISGTVERLVTATNAPLSTLKAGVPPMPDDGLSVEIALSDTVLRPIDTLPQIRDADLNVRVTGRSATVSIGHGSIELPSGRKLMMSSGVFEVPDMRLAEPPSRTRFRLDGPVPAVAELLALDRLRDVSGSPFDAATTRGTLAAQVVLGFPLKPDLPKGSSNYTINIDVANFSAERMIMGQKVEGTTLRISANNQGYQIKGDVKIGGMPATLDYRKAKDDGDAEIRIQATLDEAARAKFGFDVGNAVSGPVPIKLGGRVAANDREARFTVEADLTQARIDNLLPGWAKAAGKSARATFALVNKGQSTRFEDLAIDGAGVQVKGNVEVDASGELISAAFPVFILAEGDKTTFKVDRTADGTLRATMRGEVYDGRGFIKSAVAGLQPESRARRPINDLDLDIKLGAVVGFNGETLRGVDLKLSRRNGHIRSFTLNAKLGRNTPFVGDLRVRNGKSSVALETDDAGALFRFTDTYPRMLGGQIRVSMDAPTVNPGPQEGILNIRDFVIRGEPALDNIVAGAPNAPRDGIKFSRMQAEFTRRPGRLEIREGVVQGIVGATVDGQIDYAADEVHLRGTFVPLYELNNILGKLPLLGPLFGGKDEGLFGVTYEVVGAPGAPRLNVQPASVLAPGVFRKLFEFRGNNIKSDGFVEPSR
jgi:hypothetical protein